MRKPNEHKTQPLLRHTICVSILSDFRDRASFSELAHFPPAGTSPRKLTYVLVVMSFVNNLTLSSYSLGGENQTQIILGIGLPFSCFLHFRAYLFREFVD